MEESIEERKPGSVTEEKWVWIIILIAIFVLAVALFVLWKIYRNPGILAGLMGFGFGGLFLYANIVQTRKMRALGLALREGRITEAFERIVFEKNLAREPGRSSLWAEVLISLVEAFPEEGRKIQKNEETLKQVRRDRAILLDGSILSSDEWENLREEPESPDLLRGVFLFLSGKVEEGYAAIQSARTDISRIPAARFDPSRVNWEAEIAHVFARDLLRYRRDLERIRVVLKTGAKGEEIGQRIGEVSRKEKGIGSSWNSSSCLRYFCPGCFSLLRRFPFRQGGKCPQCRGERWVLLFGKTVAAECPAAGGQKEVRVTRTYRFDFLNGAAAHSLGLRHRDILRGVVPVLYFRNLGIESRIGGEGM